jgi:hypothetical protein
LKPNEIINLKLFETERRSNKQDMLGFRKDRVLNKREVLKLLFQLQTGCLKSEARVLLTEV